MSSLSEQTQTIRHIHLDDPYVRLMTAHIQSECLVMFVTKHNAPRKRSQNHRTLKDLPMIAFWHSEQSWKENGTNFRNIPKTLQCKDSANPSTAKQVKNQNLVQGILQSQLPCPTISQKRNPSVKLHHSGTGEKLLHTYTSDIPNPPLLPNTIFSSINSCFFLMRFPSQSVEKPAIHAIHGF